MASSYGTDADKSSLRCNYLAVRKGVPARAQFESNASILSALWAFPLFANAPLVLTYVSLPNEVGTHDIVSRVLREGRRVAVPRVCPRSHTMSFHEIFSLDELEPSTRGILEPGADTPYLAFYPGDKIGLARTGMISSNPLPAEKNDVAMDFIATEFGVWSCRGR